MEKKYILIVLVFVFIQFTGFIHGAIPASERAALIALYSGTNGENWKNKSGWKTPPLHTDGFAMPGTEGSWYGVTVSTDQLIGINLDNNGLSGSIPSELANLSKLSSLILHSNQLSGSIPPALGNLSQLRYLRLNNNQLSGGIPLQLGNLGQLLWLDLTSNKLSGSIPPELGNLSQLDYLHLSGNQLSGSIPSQLGNFSKLQELWMSGNNLSGSIPSQLGNLSQVYWISLSGNQLSGSIPPELGNLSNLRILYLQHNQLSGNIPIYFDGLRNLQTLWLAYNQLSGSIPSQLGNLSRLEELELSWNHLSGCIPSSLTNLTKITSFNICVNCLYATDPTLIAWLKSHNPGWENSQDNCGGTPTVTTNSVSSITSNSAVCGGNVTSDGGSTVTARGVCWSITSNPTTDNSKTTDGSGTGSFTSIITGLNASTKYYVKAYATNSIGTAYGPNVDFITNPTTAKATVTTNSVSSITSNSAVCGGNVTSDGGTPVTARGVCWSITPNPTSINNSKTTDGSGTGSFTSSITGLNPSTKYYVRAYATNSIGTVYGSNVDFTTGNGPTPVITVTSPNGGEQWLTGSAHSITWTTTGTVGNVKIMYTTNNGSSWRTIAPSTTNNGSYPWTVPNTVSSQCKVKISEASDENPSDTGDSVFSIISDSHPTIRLNRTKLNFNASTSGLTTGSQKVWIDNSGGGNLNWQLSTDSTWIICTPMSGTNKSIIDVSVNTSGLNPGAYSGKIMISDANATNSPQTITVNLYLKNSQQMQTPFGDFATPIDGSAISNSVPVTGWALDDIEVTNVKIYNSETFIGDAIFIEGARPDIELAYPGYPNNYKAGWGYMLLTNFLPNGGNGTYTIHAIAIDKEGNVVTLGSKTIYCDNAHAVKPFGAIDTPLQGGMASGKNYVNYGWLLTPVPNYIPANGLTISVFVDGVNIGHPTYNIFRADIANLFPGYSNSFGAVGYYYLDTTKLTDGVHTIYWIATDSGGNSDGIGSRYFMSQNSVNSGSTSASMEPGHTDLIDIPISFDRPIELIKGYAENDLPMELTPDNDGIVHIQCRELERIEVQVSLAGNEVEGYMIVGNRLMKLPIGSTLNKITGRFSWIPGPGFIGTYRLVFIETGREGEKNRKNIMISILPKFSGE